MAPKGPDKPKLNRKILEDHDIYFEEEMYLSAGEDDDDAEERTADDGDSAYESEAQSDDGPDDQSNSSDSDQTEESEDSDEDSDIGSVDEDQLSASGSEDEEPAGRSRRGTNETNLDSSRNREKVVLPDHVNALRKILLNFGRPLPNDPKTKKSFDTEFEAFVKRNKDTKGTKPKIPADKNWEFVPPPSIFEEETLGDMHQEIENQPITLKAQVQHQKACARAAKEARALKLNAETSWTRYLTRNLFKEFMLVVERPLDHEYVVPSCALRLTNHPR